MSPNVVIRSVPDVLIQDIVTTTSFNPAQGTFDYGFMIDILLEGIRKLFRTKSIVQSALGPLSSTAVARTSIRVSVTQSSLEQEQVSSSGDQANPVLITPHVTAVNQGTLVLTEERQEQPQDRVSSSDDLTNQALISRRAIQIQETSILAEQRAYEQVSLSGASPASIAPHVAVVEQGTLVPTEERQEQSQDRVSSSDDLTNLASITPRVTQTSTLAELQKLAQSYDQVFLSGDQASIVPHAAAAVKQVTVVLTEERQEQSQDRVSSSDYLTNLASIAPRVAQRQETLTLVEQQKLAQSREQVSLSSDQVILASIAPHTAAVKQGTLVLTEEERQEQSQDRVSSSDDLTNLPSITPRLTQTQGTSTLAEPEKLGQFHDQVSLSGDQASPTLNVLHVAAVEQGTLVLTEEERQEQSQDRVSSSDGLTNLASVDPRVTQIQGTSPLAGQQETRLQKEGILDNQFLFSGGQVPPVYLIVRSGDNIQCDSGDYQRETAVEALA